MGLVPLSEPLLRDIQEGERGSETPSQVGGVFEFLTPPVESWVRALSERMSIAYLETEYYAGEGFERSAVFRNQSLVLGPLEGAGAINRALRELGVLAKSGQQEFEAVGLDRHRTLEEWLSEA
jgi:hypothetical protein